MHSLQAEKDCYVDFEIYINKLVLETEIDFFSTAAPNSVLFGSVRILWSSVELHQTEF